MEGRVLGKFREQIVLRMENAAEVLSLRGAGELEQGTGLPVDGFDDAVGVQHHHAFIQRVHDGHLLAEKIAQGYLFRNGGGHGLHQSARLIVVVALTGNGDVEHPDDVGPVVVHRRGGTVPGVFLQTVVFRSHKLHGGAFGKAGADAVGTADLFGKNVAHHMGRSDVVAVLIAGIQDHAVLVRQRDGAVQHVDGLEQPAHDGGGAVDEFTIVFKKFLELLGRDELPFLMIGVHMVLP